MRFTSKQSSISTTVVVVFINIYCPFSLFFPREVRGPFPLSYTLLPFIATMAHQPPPPQQHNGGGRGRGNNGGGRGQYNPHMAGNYPPHMSYGGRGGGGGGVPQQIGAWQPAPTSVATSASVGYPNLSGGPPPGGAGANPQQQHQLQQQQPVAGGIQSPPLNSSLQQANRTQNLKPAPPHAYGGAGLPQQHQQQGAGNPQQHRQAQAQQQPNYNPYNNNYGVPNQYGYQPQHRQPHQWQEQQQQMPYAPNHPYHNGNMRTQGAGPTMYYPMVQPQPPGAINNGGTGGVAAATVGMPQPSGVTPNVVVPPPRPKKVSTITVRPLLKFRFLTTFLSFITEMISNHFVHYVCFDDL